MLYLDLFRALAAHGVNYLPVGGLAMNIHGVPRMTLDIDVILSMNEANLDRSGPPGRAQDQSDIEHLERLRG